jgi:mRNA-degrading endonuclease RelE of RelBE toxin-antitoxin system
MKIIETPIFTKRLEKIVYDDDEYRQLQNILILNPESGKIIKGSGGLRKLRWSGSGRGKRGGSRVIYYWLKDEEIIFMLLIYLKNESEDLTQDQIKILKSIVESELK